MRVRRVSVTHRARIERAPAESRYAIELKSSIYIRRFWVNEIQPIMNWQGPLRGSGGVGSPHNSPKICKQKIQENPAPIAPDPNNGCHRTRSYCTCCEWYHCQCTCHPCNPCECGEWWSYLSRGWFFARCEINLHVCVNVRVYVEFLFNGCFACMSMAALDLVLSIGQRYMYR